MTKKKKIIFIIGILLLLTGCNNAKVIPNEANEYCITNGFKQASDVNDYYYTGFVDGFIYVKQIECDSKQIFKVEHNIDCVERDKWNECIKGKLTYK